ARCSMAQQELASQMEALEKAGCTRTSSEKISTRIKVRPESTQHRPSGVGEDRNDYDRTEKFAEDTRSTGPPGSVRIARVTVTSDSALS
ncbi:MAG: hypothetical protein JWN52_6260, partial [Actinomycetia bacterium]|nr:hypothetical protein [Actinomycetes bacterium]